MKKFDLMSKYKNDSIGETHLSAIKKEREKEEETIDEEI